jgi:hypothetical protein
MKPQLSPVITDILTYARLAPSVHNTQPWSFTVTGMSIDIMANKSRILADGDPTQRELWISLGVCLETLILAAEALGHSTVITRQQTETIEQPFATVAITASTHSPQQQILDSLSQRHSYRGLMDRTSLPTNLLTNCRQAITDLAGTSVHLAATTPDIQAVADLTYKGMRLALSSPGFRRELADLINYNWSPARVGMHGFVLNRHALGSIWEKWSIKLGLDVRQKAMADRKKVATASGLVFIATEGDVPSYWLTAGRAYCRISHVIFKTGLAQSTIAAPVEAASFHEDVERLLQTPHRIQAMIRIGKPTHTPTKFSPRLSVEELLT